VDEPISVGHPPEVVGELVRGSRSSLEAAADELNTFDLVVIQHEFGIFGGEDGEEVIELVSLLEVPVVVVLHTVLATPSPHQRMVIERLARAANRVVVQSDVARTRLLASHRVSPQRLLVIPHGAPANLSPAMHILGSARRPMILTWGLIGPGKGIEFAIEAMAELRHLTPRPTYVVMGETHPKIVQASGEAYRESLVARARELGIEEMVQFEDGYRDTAAILARIRDADLILLPYLSRDQVVSGVLVEAIASGKPVVSTAFPHAVELLGAGSGTVVPHEDAGAIASALRAYLTEPGKAARATAVARRQAPTLFWENVGEAYDRLAAEIVDHRIRAAR
jgi:glycosyltransferase involved in cell wall biosynthesis